MKMSMIIALALAFVGVPAWAQHPYCYDGFPTGIHSNTPIRVAVTAIQTSAYTVGGVPFGNAPPQRKLATILLVSVLNEEAVNSGADTAFESANGPQDANLTAEVLVGYWDGINVKRRYYEVSVDFYGMGITDPNSAHIRLCGVHHPEDLSSITETAGAAAAATFHRIAKLIVRGWVCKD